MSELTDALNGIHNTLYCLHQKLASNYASEHTNKDVLEATLEQFMELVIVLMKETNDDPE